MRSASLILVGVNKINTNVCCYFSIALSVLFSLPPPLFCPLHNFSPIVFTQNSAVCYDAATYSQQQQQQQLQQKQQQQQQRISRASNICIDYVARSPVTSVAHLAEHVAPRRRQNCPPPPVHLGDWHLLFFESLCSPRRIWHVVE